MFCRIAQDGSNRLRNVKSCDRLRVSLLNVADLPSSFTHIGLLASANGDVYVTSREFPLVQIPHSLPIKGRARVPMSVTYAYRDPDGTEWFGGWNGFWRGDRNGFKSIVRPFSNRLVQAITTDGEHGLWVAISMKNGLFRFRNGVWTPYGDNPSFPRLTPHTAMTDANGRTWFGRVRRFSEREDNAIGNVSALYSRDQNIWIGGDNGLRRFVDDRFETVETEGGYQLRGVSGIVETQNGEISGLIKRPVS
jgi:hypothetical protein